MTCSRCGGNNFNYIVIQEKEKVTLPAVLFHLLLTFCIVGIIFLIFDIIKLFRSKSVTYAVCQDCGKRIKVE